MFVVVVGVVAAGVVVVVATLVVVIQLESSIMMTEFTRPPITTTNYAPFSSSITWPNESDASGACCRQVSGHGKPALEIARAERLCASLRVLHGQIWYKILNCT